MASIQLVLTQAFATKDTTLAQILYCQWWRKGMKMFDPVDVATWLCPWRLDKLDVSRVDKF